MFMASVAQSESSQQHQQPPLPQRSGHTFTLLLFASASTYCHDKEALTFTAPSTVFDLFVDLERRFPGFSTKVLRNCQIVLNLEYVDIDVDALVLDVLAFITRSSLKSENSNKAGTGKDVQGTSIKGSETRSSPENTTARKEGQDIQIKAGDEVGVVPPVSSG